MTAEITSFEEYEQQLLKKLRLLRHFERCIFAAWCVEHLLATYTQPLEQSLSESGVRSLQEIADDIWSSLLGGSVPDKRTINRLDECFLDVEAQAAQRSQGFVAIIVQQAVGLCILGCRRNDVGLAQQVGKAMPRLIGFELRDSDATVPFDEVIRHPEVQQEIVAHFAMIRHLKGEYALEPSLRAAFRK